MDISKKKKTAIILGASAAVLATSAIITGIVYSKMNRQKPIDDDQKIIDAGISQDDNINQKPSSWDSKTEEKFNKLVKYAEALTRALKASSANARKSMSVQNLKNEIERLKNLIDKAEKTMPILDESITNLEKYKVKKDKLTEVRNELNKALNDAKDALDFANLAYNKMINNKSLMQSKINELIKLIDETIKKSQFAVYQKQIKSFIDKLTDCNTVGDGFVKDAERLNLETEKTNLIAAIERSKAEIKRLEELLKNPQSEEQKKEALKKAIEQFEKDVNEIAAKVDTTTDLEDMKDLSKQIDELKNLGKDYKNDAEQLGLNDEANKVNKAIKKLEDAKTKIEQKITQKEQEVDKLKKDVKKLLKDLDVAMGECINAKTIDEFDAAISKLAKLIADGETLLTKTKEAKLVDETSELETKLERAKKVLEQTKEKRDAKSKIVDEWKTKINDEINALKAKVDATKNANTIATLEPALKELENAINHANGILSDANNFEEKTKIQAEINQLTQAIADANAEKQTSAQRLEQLKNINAELVRKTNEAIQKANAAIEEAKNNQNSDDKSKLETIIANLNDAKTQLDTTKTEVSQESSLVKQIEDKTTEVNEWITKISDQKQKVEQKEAEIAQKKQDIDAQIKELDKKQKALEEASKDGDKNKINEAIKKLEEEIDKAKKLHDDNKNEPKLNEDNQKLQDKIDEINKKNLNAIKKRINDTVSDLQNAINDANSAISDTHNLEKVNAALGKITTSITNANDVKQDVEAHKDQYLTEFNKLQSKIEEAIQKQSTLQTQKTNIEKERAKADEEFNKFKEKVNKIISDYEANNTTSAAVKKSIQDLEQATLDANVLESKTQVIAYNALLAKISILKSTISTNLAKMRLKLSQLEEAEQKEEDRINQIKAEVNTMISNLNSGIHEVEKEHTTSTSLRSDISALESIIELAKKLLLKTDTSPKLSTEKTNLNNKIIEANAAIKNANIKKQQLIEQENAIQELEDFSNNVTLTVNDRNRLASTVSPSELTLNQTNTNYEVKYDSWLNPNDKEGKLEVEVTIKHKKYPKINKTYFLKIFDFKKTFEIPEITSNFEEYLDFKKHPENMLKDTLLSKINKFKNKTIDENKKIFNELFKFKNILPSNVEFDYLSLNNDGYNVSMKFKGRSIVSRDREGTLHYDDFVQEKQINLEKLNDIIKWENTRYIAYRGFMAGNKYVYYVNDMNNEIHIDKVKEKFKDKILTTSLIEETLNWLVPISKKWRDICKALFDENKNSAGWVHGVYPSLSARPFNAYNEK